MRAIAKHVPGAARPTSHIQSHKSCRNAIEKNLQYFIEWIEERLKSISMRGAELRNGQCAALGGAIAQKI
jgi:hypothetical protein